MKRRLSAKTKSNVTRVARSSIPENQIRILYVQAGGRCEFDGCNKYLLKHSVTQTVGNFGDIAHIVAFNKQGPRGKQRRTDDPHALENLMLLCNECHRLIDRNPVLYSVSILRTFKRQHEANIYFATSVPRIQKTALVRLEAPIGGKPASIPLPQIYSAITPKHPFEKPLCLIDLNQHLGTDDRAAFFASASEMIKHNVKEFLRSCLSGERVDHISVFGLAPIPLLIVLGDQLSNTIPLEVYHHHHDQDNWTWKEDSEHVHFEYELLRKGTDLSATALLMSVSGKVQPTTLPDSINERFYVYEIRTTNCKPSTNALRTREGLENFRRTYEDWRRYVWQTHGQVKAIHLFPAIPPPVAILCGRELMPKVDPALLVYDFNKRLGGFNFVLEVNPNER